jgi:hypothetical protein
MKTDVRVVDYGYFATDTHELELYTGLRGMLNKGWNVLKIYEPMKYKNSEEYFSRVIYTRVL